MLSMLLAGAAHGAEPCLTVALRGEPLPYGLALLMPVGVPGRPPRGPLRIREGRFCAPGLAEGQYRVDLLSEFDLTPLACAWKEPGPAGRVLSWRGADGWAPKGLSLELAAVSAAAPALHGTLRFSTTTQASAGAGVLLAGACYEPGCPGARCDWTLINSSGPAVRGFSFSAPACGLRSLWAASSDWAPRLWKMSERRAGAGAGGPQAEVELVAGARVEGRVLLPDGTPFRPRPGSRLQEDGSSMFWIEARDATRDDSLYLHRFFADDQGRLLGPALAPGLYSFVPQYAGSGFRWSPAPGTLRWVSAGAPVELEVRLSPGAEIAVEPPLHPRLAKTAGAATSVTELIGLPEGGFEKEAVSRALGSEGSSFMFLLEDGAWITSGRASGPQGAGAALAAPGHYDAAILEMTDIFDRPAVRVLSAARSVRVGAGERAVLRFEKFLAAGSAEIRGSFNGGKVPPPALLKKASSSGRLYSLLSPRLELRRDGVLAAVAYGTFPWDIRKIILDAAAADDPAPLEKALAGPRPFRIDGLPDGNYEARVISFGAPDRERKVRLEGGKPLIWDLELGPEARH